MDRATAAAVTPPLPRTEVEGATALIPAPATTAGLDPDLIAKVLDHSPVPTLIVGEDGIVVCRNRAHESIFEGPQGDCLPIPLEELGDLVNPSSWEQLLGDLEAEDHVSFSLKARSTRVTSPGTASRVEGHEAIALYFGGDTALSETAVELERPRAMHAEAQLLAKLGHWTLRHADNKILWSSEVYRIFEIDPHEFDPSYEAFLEIIHPEDRDLVNRAFSDSVAKRADYQVTHRLRMADGRIKHVEERGRTTYDEQGDPVTSVGTVQDISEVVRINVELARHREGVVQAMLAAITAVSRSMEIRDPYTSGHQERVSQIAATIAKRLNLSETRITGVRVGALVHDVGKLAIPQELLTRPSTLSHEEMSLIRTHAKRGAEIFEGISFPWPVQEMVLQHHERLDGSGYPRGLVGDEILLEARILSVADVYEAIASHRPYRPGQGTNAAIDELKLGSGKLYDPVVVEALLDLIEEDPDRFTTPH